MRDSGRKFHIIRIVVGSSLLLALVAALAWNVWGAIAGSVGSSEFKEDPCSQFEEPAAFNACVEPYVEKYKQEQADFRQRFAASGQDTHTLRSVQRPLENTYIVDPKRLLDESDLIIRGTVVSQTLGGDYGGGAVVSIVASKQTLKGNPVQDLSVEQIGYPVMEEDGPTLVESSSNPLLWLGHEYILYLNDKDGDGRYAVDSGNAQYTIENGLITTPGDTEWAKNANGMPVGDFIAQIERDVAAGNAGR